MPKRICVLALIGLPAAGKTSFSRWLANASTSTGICEFKVMHFCFDDILKIPSSCNIADFDYKVKRAEILQTLGDSVRCLKTTDKMRLQQQQRISCSASEDYLLICDDNNYYRSMRYKLYQCCRNEAVAYAQIYFAGDKQVVLERNAVRTAEQRLPANVLQKMSKRLEPPEPEKYAWEAATLMIDYNDPWEKALPFLVSCFDHVPAALSVVKRPVAAQAELHQLDLLLRKRVKQQLEEVKCIEKSHKALLFNERRKQILQTYKNEMPKTLGTSKDLQAYVEMLH